MDILRTRRLSGRLIILSVIAICAGAAIYLTVSEVLGLAVAVVAMAVLVICLGIRGFIRNFAFQSMVRGAGRGSERPPGDRRPEGARRKGKSFPEARASVCFSICSCRKAGAS